MSEVESSDPQWMMGDGTSVYAHEGRIKCNTHVGGLICEHIESVVERAWDEQEVWYEDEVEVPLFGGNVQMWTRVAFDGAPEKDQFFRKVYLCDDGINGDNSYLGVLAKGEGRKAIRNLCAVWIQNTYLNSPNPLLTCKSSAHDFAAEQQLRRLWAEGPEARSLFWASYWSLFFYNACLECRVYLPRVSSLQHFSDVPEV